MCKKINKALLKGKGKFTQIIKLYSNYPRKETVKKLVLFKGRS